MYIKIEKLESFSSSTWFSFCLDFGSYTIFLSEQRRIFFSEQQSENLVADEED
jgi:hypothetical protein